MLPIVVEKTVRLSGLDWEDQCIFSTQSEIGLFPTGEESLYAHLRIGRPRQSTKGIYKALKLSGCMVGMVPKKWFKLDGPGDLL